MLYGAAHHLFVELLKYINLDKIGLTYKKKKIVQHDVIVQVGGTVMGRY